MQLQTRLWCSSAPSTESDATDAGDIDCISDSMLGGPMWFDAHHRQLALGCVLVLFKPVNY